MDPIGTVTNFYPFLSEDTRTIVDAILKQAEGYDDFASKLVDIVLAQEVTTDLTHFTVIQAWTTINPVIFNKLRPRLREDVLLKPWSFYNFEGTPEEYESECPPSFDEALHYLKLYWYYPQSCFLLDPIPGNCQINPAFCL